MGNIFKIQNKRINKEYKIIFVIHPRYRTLKPILINSKKIF